MNSKKSSGREKKAAVRLSQLWQKGVKIRAGRLLIVEISQPAQPKIYNNQMSNLAFNQDDFPDAAAKNLDDASALFTSNRHDGSGYHSGYVIECILKSLIIVAELAKQAPLGPQLSLAQFLTNPSAQKLSSGYNKIRSLRHNLNALSTEARSLASQPTAATSAYTPSLALSKLTMVGVWSETIRYRSSGYINPTTSAQWLAESKNIYSSTIAKMVRDGIIRL